MKVGNTVIVHDITECDYGCTESMREYEGKVGVITRVIREYDNIAYKLNIDKGKYLYSENVLRKIYSKLLENE